MVYHGTGNHKSLSVPCLCHKKSVLPSTAWQAYIDEGPRVGIEVVHKMDKGKLVVDKEALSLLGVSSLSSTSNVCLSNEASSGFVIARSQCGC